MYEYVHTRYLRNMTKQQKGKSSRLQAEMRRKRKLDACDTQGEKDTNATTSVILILLYRRGRCRANTINIGKQRLSGMKPARVEAAAPEQQHLQQHALDPQRSRSLLTDPLLQLCLLPEVTQLGCLPGPEAARQGRPPGLKQKPSGQSYCVDPVVG